MSRTLRILGFALLLAAFAGPAARAAPWGALDWLDRLRAALGSIWAENGCSVDPNGHCGTVAVVNGCGLDPNGRCGAITADNGCGVDPDGRCRAISLTNGCELDPDGRCKDRQ